MENYALDVENLAVKHRARAAIRSLMAGGVDAAQYVRQGLHHANADVVIACCLVLDHFLYDEAVPDLIGLLKHPVAEVRAWAMHALACDRCKEGSCRPGEDDSIPLALSMLASDPSPAVRVQARRSDLSGRASPRRCSGGPGAHPGLRPEPERAQAGRSSCSWRRSISPYVTGSGGARDRPQASQAQARPYLFRERLGR